MAGLWLGIIGFLSAVGGVVALIFGFTNVSGLIPEELTDGHGDPGPAAIGDSEVPGEFTAELEEGETYRLYMLYDEELEAPQVEELMITDPDGESVHHSPPDVDTSSTSDGNTVEGYRDIDADEAGEYAFTVTDVEAGEAADSVSVALAPLDDAQAFGLVGGVIGIVAGIALLIFGVPMAIIGLVLYLVGRSRRHDVVPYRRPSRP